MTDFDGWALVGPAGNVLSLSHSDSETGAWQQGYWRGLIDVPAHGLESFQRMSGTLGYRVAKVKLVEVRDE